MEKSDCAWRIIEKSGSEVEREIGRIGEAASSPVSMGKSSRQNITFGGNDAYVSQHQLDLERIQGVWHVVNKGRNAGQILGRRNNFQPDESLPMANGLCLQFGDTRIAFFDKEFQSEFHLEISVDGRKISATRIGGVPLKVGSRSSNDVVVSADGVSRSHFSIGQIAKDRFLIQDLGSKNGLFVKNKESNNAGRVDRIELGVNEAFGFGTAVGKITADISERCRRNRFKWYVIGLIGIVMVVGGIFWTKPRDGNQNKKNDNPLPTFHERLKDAWLIENNAERIEKLDRLRNTIGAENQREKRRVVDELLSILAVQNKLADQIERAHQAVSELSARAARDPWSLQTSFTALEADFTVLAGLADDFKTSLRKADTLASESGLSADEIRYGLNTRLSSSADEMGVCYRHVVQGFDSARALLTKWAENRFLVTDADIVRWSSAFGLFASDKTEETIEMLRAIVGFNGDVVERWKNLMETVLRVTRNDVAQNGPCASVLPDPPVGLPHHIIQSLEERSHRKEFGLIVELCSTVSSQGDAVRRWTWATDVLTVLNKVGTNDQFDSVIHALADYRAHAKDEVLRHVQHLAEELNLYAERLEQKTTFADANTLARLVPDTHYIRVAEAVTGKESSSVIISAYASSEAILRDICESWYATASCMTDATQRATLAAQVHDIVTALQKKNRGTTNDVLSSGWKEKLIVWARSILDARKGVF